MKAATASGEKPIIWNIQFSLELIEELPIWGRQRNRRIGRTLADTRGRRSLPIALSERRTEWDFSRAGDQFIFPDDPEGHERVDGVPVDHVIGDLVQGKRLGHEEDDEEQVKEGDDGGLKGENKQKEKNYYQKDDAFVSIDLGDVGADGWRSDQGGGKGGRD